MSNDFLIKNSFYGFNKQDVLSYIEKIKQESQSYKEDKAKVEDELSIANEKITNLENELNNRQEQTQTQEDDKQSISEEEFLSLKNENEELKVKVEDLSTECNKYKQTSKQFNSLILDAYIQSESILKDAREKAKSITNETKGAVKEATVDIGDFSEYVNNISIDFSQIVSELTNNIKNLTGNLINATEGVSEFDIEKDQEILDGFEELINRYTIYENDESENKEKIIEDESVQLEDNIFDSVKEEQEINGNCSSVKYESDKIINIIDEYIYNETDDNVEPEKEVEKQSNQKSNKVKVVIKSNRNTKG